MKKINILHISDAHIQKEYEQDIKKITEKLIDDVKRVQEQKNISIDMICFTGDLIQRGDKALSGENQWELAMQIMIRPLLKELGLGLDKFFFVPGNHEVNIERIVPRLEKGLEIQSLQDINDILRDFDESYKDRISYIYDIVKEQHENIIFGKLGYCFVKEVKGLSVGVVCVDSAWRSSGKGAIERGKLYVGVNQIRNLLSMIENCDLKICMMHHPIEWLEEFENREIERELSKFDLVLRGHVHETDLKQVIKTDMQTIFCTAGKLYPLDYVQGRAVDGYNGYSILSIDYDKSKCNLFVRTYYAQNREEFDMGINVCPDGEKEFDIFSKEPDYKVEHELVRGIKEYICNMSEKYMMIRSIDTDSPKDFQQIMVEPVLNVKSEYVKENNKETDENINISNIVDTDNNVILIGKKESGKTTVLQQIALEYINLFDVKKIVPIYIDMKYLPKGPEKLFNAAVHFAMENVLPDVAINRQQIMQLFDDGKVVFLIDNVIATNSDHTVALNKFISKLKNNRFIITIEEEFFQSIDIRDIPDYGESFKEYYIQCMGKAQIRSMVKQWAKGKDAWVDIDETVNKIDMYCNQINFAKTPFNISVFMVLWDYDNNFIPINEGVVMENYLEIILEKLTAKEGYRSNYSFKIKQNFLSFVAHEMYSKDKFYFTKQEFIYLLDVYHEQKGYDLNQSKFDSIFFEKNILSYSGQYVVFSHTSFLEYYLALYAYNNKSFLEEITSKGIRTNFKNEICFYAGLNQDCTNLLDKLSDSILDIVLEYTDLIEGLNDLELVTEFKFDKETFIQKIKKNRFSQEEIDAIDDKIKRYENRKPTELSKRDVRGEEAEDFFSLLQMYGSVIKNAELLDKKYKVMHLETYMYGMNTLYAMLIKLFEYVKDKMAYGAISEADRETLGVSSEEEFEKMKAELVDTSKMLFPIAIQNMILENIGTPKLLAAINDLIYEKKNKPFEKFMLTFLKCDLKIVDLGRELKQYIEEEESKVILQLILFKLTFYYRMRFFGNNQRIDNQILDLITNIQRRLEPKLRERKYDKSLVTKAIKNNLDSKR